MKKIARKNILSVKPYVPGKPIEEVKRELKLKQAVKLASNESPFGPSPKVLKAIVRAGKLVNRYPASDCYYLRAELAKRLKVSRDQLIFGNGSDELIILALRAFVNPGEEVVIAKPSFLIYEIAAKIVGAKIKAVPLKGLRYDLDGMKKAVTKKTKLVFIGNPDNPAGTYVTKKELNGFLKGLRKDILVFIDEAYFEYVSQKDYPDGVKLAKTHKNIIATRTFSKMYGLAGLRIGYGVADRGIIDIFDRIREPFNVNSIAQEAALACLQDQEYYLRIAKKVEKQKAFIQKSLAQLGLETKPSFTNFIIIDVKQDSSLVVKKLLKKGIIVRDMKFWGLKGFIRLSIGTDAENRKFLNALRSIL